MEKLLTVQDVAEQLGVSVKTLYNWHSQTPKQGPVSLKVGRYLRYRPDAVESFIASLERRAS